MVYNKRGFSLLELIVSIGILSTTIVGLVSFIVFLNQTNKNQEATIFATYLAKEGLEVTTYLRDNNFLNNRNYSNNIYKSNNKEFILIFNNGEWSVDFGKSNETIESCCTNSSGNCIVYKTDKYYTQSRTVLSNPTNYCRLITVSDEGDYLNITSEVLFNKDTTKQSIIKLTKQVYDWKDN